jgi:curved DNA-binding protein CbpA
VSVSSGFHTMKDYYKILQVDRNSTDSEIKKAYHELALKYHPDRTKDQASHARFTEINEAYQVLGKKENRDDYNLTFDYRKYGTGSGTPYYAPPGERSPGSPNAKTRYYRPGYVYRKNEQVNLAPYIRSVRIISTFTFLFVLLLALDYFLPNIIDEQTIVAKQSTYNSFNSIILATEKHEFPVSYDYANLVFTGNKARVELSPIFNIQQRISVDTGIDTYVFKPHYSIYNVYSFFLVILLGTSYLGAFQKKDNAELVFSAGVANVFLAVLIIFLVHIS